MDRVTFRKRLIQKIDERLSEDDLDDEMLFSDFWEPIREHIDETAENEDNEEGVEVEEVDEDDRIDDLED